MKAEDQRWAMIRLSVPCSCGEVVALHAPTTQVQCGCGADLPVKDFPRIGYETGPILDTLAKGAVRQKDHLSIGRQPPACGGCGQNVQLSAADLGQHTSIFCSHCDATTFSWPAPDWLQSHLLGAQQVYAGCLPNGVPPSDTPIEPVWMRCAACETGMRIDEDSERLTRCGSCHALNHVPDPVWQTLHPLRSSGAWYVLFESLTTAERQRRAQIEEAVRGAIMRIGLMAERDRIHADVNVLRRMGDLRSEQALIDALSCKHPTWFDAALRALADMPGPRMTARLNEALEAEEQPERRLALAQELLPRDREAAVETLAQLSESLPVAVATQALDLLATVDAETAVKKAERLAHDAPLGVRRSAVKVLIHAGRTRLGPAVLPLLEHRLTAVQQRTVRLIMGDARSVRAALLGLSGQDVALEVERALADAPAPYPEAVLNLARNAATQERIVATRWLKAVGWAPHMANLYADLRHHTGTNALLICDAISAKTPAERSTALTKLLNAPTLKLRLDAARLLADDGLPGALEALDELAGGWFTNRELKAAADTAARTIRWRVSQGTGGGLSVHDAGELTLKDPDD